VAFTQLVPEIAFVVGTRMRAGRWGVDLRDGGTDYDSLTAW
jgi:hypothetical protein